jgi:choline-sulfatase
MIPRRRHLAWICAGSIVTIGASACSSSSSAPPAPATQARHLVLITIDTLRADRVGAYGYARARTPRIDALASRGARFDHAYSTAPITLTSHASLMTGRYPPGHGARHNGVTVDPRVPTLATALATAGFSTGAFVGAFPLDHRFGLNKGFGTYGDHMPRSDDGRLANERPGRDVAGEAVAWLEAHRNDRRFLWVHFFEPHAPYGDPRSGRSVADRYDDDVAEADVQVGKIVDALGADASSSLIVVASDHGEAFGEHGEVSHSLFVYDTTLRVPLIMAGPSIPTRTIAGPVSLIDVVPTVLKLLNVKELDADGIDLTPAMNGGTVPDRSLYAESFAPLLDFGWAPLRSIRSQGVKYIDAPKPELYDVVRDPGETRDVSGSDAARVATLREQVQRYAPAAANSVNADPEALARLQALGYVAGGGPGSSARPFDAAQGRPFDGAQGRPFDGAQGRPDPKDRRALAADLARIASGELNGPALEATLRQILKNDPRNPQANLRLGYVLLESNRCPAAVLHFTAAIAAHVPTADAHLGLAQCQVAEQRYKEAQTTLLQSDSVERGNPAVLANLGIVLSAMGRHSEAIAPLQAALVIDPDFHEARFNLARVFARQAKWEDAAREAKILLARLPKSAPQRAEVERLLKAVE